MINARKLPAFDLVNAIRIKLMNKFELRRKLAGKWKGTLTPYADNCVKDISRNLGDWNVRRLDD